MAEKDDNLDGFRDTSFENDMQVQKVRLGLEAERFLDSMLGKYLLGRADIEREDAIKALIDADPEDAKANREQRNRIAVVDMVLDWINEAIESGRAAEVQIKVEEAEEQ